MIAFDAAASSSDVSGTATSLTYSHTCSGNYRVLIVGLFIGKGSDLVTSVKYNGVLLTLINKIQQNGGSGYGYLFYLVNPSTGANNVVVNLSSGANIYASSASYTGAAQNQPDSSNTNTVSGASLTLTDTVVNSNCWLISVVGDTNGQSAGSGVNAVRANPGTGAIGDSNGTVSTGSQSQTWTSSAGPMVGVIAAISPAIIGFDSWASRSISQPYFPAIDINLYSVSTPNAATYMKIPPPKFDSWASNPISQPYFPALDLNRYLVAPVSVSTYFTNIGWHKIPKSSDLWTKVTKTKITSG